MKDQSDQIPVVLFTYARPAHLARVLACLKGNHVPLILAFADGSKGAADAAAVAETRALLRGVDWCDLRLTERGDNMGLGRNILSGVTEIAARHEAFIVWEDDLVCVPGTYGWMCAALRHYAGDNRVMSVSAWTHPRVTPPDVGDGPYFDARADCWVWGSWARSWKGMNDQTAAEKMRAAAGAGMMPDSYGADLPVQASAELQKNTWAVRWLYHHLQYHGLCLRPPWSLVEHIGFDDEATNAGGAEGWANPPLRRRPIMGEWPVAREHPACRGLWLAANQPAARTLIGKFRWAVRRFVPDALLAATRRRFFRVRWTGDYPDWESALAVSTGYHADGILRRVTASARLVRDGRKGFERDGMAFDGAPPWWQGQDSMLAASRAKGGALNVVDFGGSLGSLYFQCRSRFPEPRKLRWNVVEQPTFVETGRREFESDELRFHHSIDEAFSSDRPDVLILGSVLPYLPRPLEILGDLLRTLPPLVLIERTGFVVEGRARLTVQHVPRSIYAASYPCWFLNRQEFLAHFAGVYRLTFEQREDIETPRGLEFRSLQFDRGSA